MRLPIRVLLATATSLALFAGRAIAQVHGHVNDLSGAPVAAAVVELWSPTERVSITTTDSRGDFRLATPAHPNSLGIFVRRIGYRPVRRQVESVDIRLVVTLVPMAVELAPIQITEAAKRCPQRDDRRARQRWNQIRAGYSQATDSLGTAVRFWEDYREGPTLDLGEVDTAGAPPGVRLSRGSARVSWRRRVARSGYAWPTTGDASGVHDQWDYPPLGADFAPHFVDSLFAARHTIRILDSTEAETVFAFCERSRKQPGIEATISVTPDGTILQATWAFLTPEPIEHAGGRAYFAPRGAAGTGAFLLPIASYFWRDGRLKGYYVAAWRYRQWYIGDSDAMPRERLHEPSRNLP